MKWMFTALLVAGLISCSEDDAVEPPFINNGEVSVTLNGEDFFSQFTTSIRAETAITCFPGKMSVIVNYYNEAGEERGGFNIFNVPFEVGTYDIHRIEPPRQVCLSDTVHGSFYTSVSDGDVNGDFYFPLEGAENQITLTSHNPSTREVMGTFNVVFVIIDEHRMNKTVKDAPDTIRLTDGKFKATYDMN